MSVAGRAAAPPPVALPAQTPGGRYKVHFQIWLPRAMEVSWTLRCGGHEQRGVIGETFEQYVVRRTAEIQADRQRERERRAQVGSLVGGAVLGQAQAAGAVHTPNAQGEAAVTVDGAAAGAAVGASTVTDAPIVLAPDDLGQGFRQGDIGFHLGDAVEHPACAMELAPVDPAADTSLLAGTYTVERWFDAKHAARVRVAAGVTTVRADLRARLVARGADPTLAERRRAEAMARLKAEHEAEEARRAQLRAQEEARRAEQRAADDARRAEEEARRAQLEAQRQAELDAERAREAEERRLAQLEIDAQLRIKLELEARIRAEVLTTREALYVYYGKCGGNRYRRQELAAAEEQRRLRVEAEARMRLQMAIDIRARLRGGLIAYGADPGLRARLEAEARARAAAEEEARRRRIAAAEAESRRRAALEAAERERRRAEAEAELRRRTAEEEARAAAELVAWEAEQAESSRRLAIVIGVRAQLTDSLLAMGARLRPPMPPPVDDRGHWTWSGAQWMWIEGGVDITVPVRVDIDLGGRASTTTHTHVESREPAREPVREHRSTVGDHVEQPPREQERDHRTPASTTTTTTTTTTPAPPPSPTRPRVRDHR